MLSSVFSRRKGIQRKISNFTQIRRAQSPPSPGSFVTPEISEKPFNPYSLYIPSTSQHSVNQAAFTFSQSQPQGAPSEPSKRASSPRVQLEFSAEALSLSDWFPAELLQARSDSPARRPERNVSLGVTSTTSGTSGYQGGSAHGGTRDSAIGSSGTAAADSTAHIPETVLESDENDEDNAGHGYAPDDVIVIEAPRGRDVSDGPCHTRVLP